MDLYPPRRDSSDDLAGNGRLLCEWKHSPVPSTQGKLLCEWKHSPVRARKSSSLQQRQEPQLLVEWKHPPSKFPRRNSLAKEGRSISEPMMNCDHDGDDTSGHDDSDEESLLDRLGSSMRSLLDYGETETPSQRRSRGLAKRTNSKQQKEDGIVTYLGRDYSARDVLELCHSRRSSKGSVCSLGSTKTLESLDNKLQREEDEANGLGTAIVRGLSNLVGVGVGGGATDDDNISACSLGPYEQHGGTRSHHLPTRTLPRRQRSESPRRTAAATARPLLDEPLDRDNYLDMLAYDQDDVLDIAEDPKDFAALKKTLKRNGAITNTLLQQGLHVFVHQNRSIKQRQRIQKQQQAANAAFGVHHPSQQQQALSA